jgi:hypothetical protein
MKLPNCEHAVADIEKFRDYCLNPEHPVGKHKARVFKAALGFTQEDAEPLREMVLEFACQCEAVVGEYLPLYGQTYTVDFTVEGLTNDVTIRTAWIVEEDTDFPRLTTCYVVV